MKDYELKTCEAILRDIKVLGGTEEWDIDTVYNMWSRWSELLSAGWLGYVEGDLGMLENVIDILFDEI